MESVKELALTKMLEEMSKEHDETIDLIHNYLCEQENEELFSNILKEGKSIASSWAYATRKAKEHLKSKNGAVADHVVFGWIQEYFASDEKDLKPVAVSKPARNDDIDDDDLEEDKKPVPKKKAAQTKAEKKAAAERERIATELAKKAAAEKEAAERDAAEKVKKKELKKLGIVDGQVSIFDLMKVEDDE